MNAKSIFDCDWIITLFLPKFPHRRPKARKSNFSIRQKLFSLLSLSCKYWLQNSDPMCPFRHINFVEFVNIFSNQTIGERKAGIVFKFVCWVRQRNEKRLPLRWGWEKEVSQRCLPIIIKLMLHNFELSTLLFYQYSCISKQKSYRINIIQENIWIKKQVECDTNTKCKFGLSFKILKESETLLKHTLSYLHKNDISGFYSLYTTMLFAQEQQNS